jgi:hypothetical protein
MIDQPNFNWATQNNRGEWSLRDVSAGAVFLASDGKPACIDHGAMNCVVPDKTIWRCLMCGRSTYTTREQAHA